MSTLHVLTLKTTAIQYKVRLGIVDTRRMKGEGGRACARSHWEKTGEKALEESWRPFQDAKKLWPWKKESIVRRQNDGKLYILVRRRKKSKGRKKLLPSFFFFLSSLWADRLCFSSSARCTFLISPAAVYVCTVYIQTCFHGRPGLEREYCLCYCS